MIYRCKACGATTDTDATAAALGYGPGTKVSFTGPGSCGKCGSTDMEQAQPGTAAPAPRVTPAEPPQPVASLKDGLLGLINVFIDPASTARRIRLQWFWVYPLVVFSIVMVIAQLQMVPYKAQVTPIQPGGPTHEQLMMFNVIGAYVTPVFIVIFVAIGALLLLALGTIIDARVRFRDLFTLLITVGMIGMLQQIATVVVLKTKAPEELTSMRELLPPFGLDIFVNVTGVLGSILGFFSIFQIWGIVILGLTYAHLAKVSKGKAFFATSPSWLLGLLGAIIGGFFIK